jgi:VCBS repeat-containing protein
VLVNDTDEEGDALRAVLETDAAYGTVTLNPDGSFTYKSTSNHVGTDSFTYRANDGSEFSAITTVSFAISAPTTPLTVGAAGMTTNGFRFQITGPTPATYIILASSNLRDWIPISTNDAPTGTVEFTDTTAVDHPLRWYQAIVETAVTRVTP